MKEYQEGCLYFYAVISWPYTWRHACNTGEVIPTRLIRGLLVISGRRGRREGPYQIISKPDSWQVHQKLLGSPLTSCQEPVVDYLRGGPQTAFPLAMASCQKLLLSPLAPHQAGVFGDHVFANWTGLLDKLSLPRLCSSLGRRSTPESRHTSSFWHHVCYFICFSLPF